MSEQTAKTTDIYALTSLRGVAALWVLLHHFSPDLFNLLPAMRWFQPILKFGHLAVPLFFILSGYVLGIRYLDRFQTIRFKELLLFWWLRLGRIYPVHLAALFCCLLLVISSKHPVDPRNSLDSFLANIFLVHAWEYEFTTLAWNYPSWSISSEWFAYLLFPTLAWSVCRLSIRTTSILFLLTIPCSVMVFTLDSIVFRGLVYIIPTFFGGVFLARLHARWQKTIRFRLTDFLVILGIVLPYLVTNEKIVHACYLVLFFLLVLLFALAGNTATWIWKSRALVFLGNISYSLYMTHALVLMVLGGVIPFGAMPEYPLITRILTTLGCLIAMFAAAIVMYYFVEKPWRTASRRASRSIRPQTQSGP
ncbi:MAG: acyltransferase [Zavarzinella sp.]